MWLDDLSYKLMRATWIPWRWRHQGGPLNTVLYTRSRRRKLGLKVQKLNQSQPDSFTVVIGTSHRRDFRLVRALQSIRQQDYPQDQVKILVVDYGNGPDIASWLKETVESFDGQVIAAVPPRGVWNRSHCLNVGIKQTTTKFVISSDVDVMFAPNYLATVAATLKADPFQVIFSQCLDLPPEAVPVLENLDNNVEFSAVRAMGKGRDLAGKPYSNGINASYTHFYHAIQGYDEYFELWGSEDNDLARRFSWMGLKLTSVADKTCYLHQWHPKHEGVKIENLEEIIERNRQHEFASRKIVVNDENWGKAK